MGSAPKGVHCALTSVLCKFPEYFDWCQYPGLSWCPSPVPSPSTCISHRFSIHFSSTAIAYHSCFFFMTDVSAPAGRLFTYSIFRWVSRFGNGSGTRYCGPRGGTGVCMKQKSPFKFLPWPGFEPRTFAVWWPRTSSLDYSAPTVRVSWLAFFFRIKFPIL